MMTVSPRWLWLWLGLLAACASGGGAAPTTNNVVRGHAISHAAPTSDEMAVASAKAGVSSANVTRIERPPVSPATQAIVDAADRTQQDRALDEGRRPAELLAFLGVRPGMRVAEVGASGGYTTELLARAVGSPGVVYAHNSPFILQRFAAQPWSERLSRPAMKTVVRVDREFDDPLPPEAKNLDLVVAILIYHDTVWMKVDRVRMNRAVFAALRPGGIYAIVDHSARPGAGLNDVQTFHRIDEKAVITEVERVGFRLASTADFLRNSQDTRDWNDSPRAAGDRRGKSDRFALAFTRP